MSELLQSGIKVVVSSALPNMPSDGTRARRMVRHGLADVLAWLGESVGPAVDEITHCYYAAPTKTLFASAEFVARLRDVELLA